MVEIHKYSVKQFYHVTVRWMTKYFVQRCQSIYVYNLCTHTHIHTHTLTAVPHGRSFVQGVKFSVHTVSRGNAAYRNNTDSFAELPP